jgi:glycosyltransferase involved in cell wall biosynthesis
MQSTPRTVVFIESASAMGGVQFSTLYLAQELDRARWNPVVVCPAEGDLTRACRNAGVETQVLAGPRFWSTSVRAGRNIRLPNPFAWLWNLILLLRAVRLLRLFLVRCPPDVLVTKGLQSHFIGGLAARRARVRCVWHVQDLVSERSFGIYRRVFSFAASRLPQQIIVDGLAIRDQLPQSLHSRVSVVHNGVDTRVFHPNRDGLAVRRELGIASDQIVIGQAGRITPWKGQHYLIEAFAKIADRIPNAVLLLVGAPVFDNDAYERRLRNMAAECGFADRIIFSGYRHDLPDVLAAMDLFAFTSTEKDTSPLALLSAMASGLPIIAFDIEGVRELVAGNEALYVAPGDSAALAKAIATTIVEGGRASQRGKAARELAEDKFDLHHYVSRIEDQLAGSSTAPNENHVFPRESETVLSSNRSQGRRKYAVVAAIFLCALTVRVGFVSFVKVSELAGGDGPSFEKMARSMVRGETAKANEGYAVRMPGFPFVMAQIYRFGESRYRVYLLQSIIGALSAVMLFLLLLRFDPWAAVLASGILAFHPVMLLFAEQILTENITVFLFILITYLAVRAIDKTAWLVPLGIIWGLFILTRSEATLTVLPTIAVMTFLSRERRWLKVLAPIALAAIVVAPWAYRNYRVVGQATLQTALGWNMYVSFNPAANGTCYEPPDLPGAPVTEAERNRFYLRQSMLFIRDNPGKAVRLVAAKQYYFWQSWNNRLLDTLDLLLLPLALGGVFIVRRKKDCLLLLCPPVGLTAVFVVFQAVGRYRVPIYPFAISFSGFALAHLIYALRQKELPLRFRRLVLGTAD